MVSQTCRTLLAQARAFHPLYDNRLASHLPMALIALDRMGASSTTLDRFYVKYSKKLQPIESGATALDPRDLIGTGRNFERYLAFYSNAIKRDGSASVLRSTMPLLIAGVAASAFHALIRLAYAIDANDDCEIAFSLAFWAMEYQATPLSMQIVPATLDDIAAPLRSAVRNHVFAPGIIIDKMVDIMHHPALKSALVQPATLTLKNVAAFCLSAFAQQDNFTLLHFVSACHAFRLVLPFIVDEQLAVRHLWHAVLLAYLTVEHVPSASAAADSATTWDACLLQASRSDDAHIIKLCYSSSCEYAQYGDGLYLAIAERSTR